MPIYQSDIAKLQTPDDKFDGRRAPGIQVSADVSLLTSTYTLLGTELATDFIEIGTLPTGARMIPHLCRVVVEAASALAGTVGDAADAARYSTAMALTTAGTYPFLGGTSGALTPFLNVVNTPILFDITTAPAGGAGKKITFLLAFTAQS